MISSQTEYSKAREELQYMTDWLSRLQGEGATVRKGLTTASVRKMIARLEEEIAEYEAANGAGPPTPEEGTEPSDGGAEA